jgi:hypothetical protein
MWSHKIEIKKIFATIHSITFYTTFSFLHTLHVEYQAWFSKLLFNKAYLASIGWLTRTEHEMVDNDNLTRQANFAARKNVWNNAHFDRCQIHFINNSLHGNKKNRCRKIFYCARYIYIPIFIFTNTLSILCIQVWQMIGRLSLTWYVIMYQFNETSLRPKSFRANMHLTLTDKI